MLTCITILYLLKLYHDTMHYSFKACLKGKTGKGRESYWVILTHHLLLCLDTVKGDIVVDR